MPRSFLWLKQLFKKSNFDSIIEGGKAAITLSWLSCAVSRELCHRGDNGITRIRNVGRPVRIKLLGPSLFIVPVQSRLIAVESTNGIAFEAGIVKRKEGETSRTGFLPFVKTN